MAIKKIAMWTVVGIGVAVAAINSIPKKELTEAEKVQQAKETATYGFAVYEFLAANCKYPDITRGDQTLSMVVIASKSNPDYDAAAVAAEKKKIERENIDPPQIRDFCKSKESYVRNIRDAVEN